ncbi:MAG: hypothetical protein EA413_06500 [Cyanobium sp. PLM2.Bin73]|nr:MAG: hypothetical protein EA413_06500 [Cyanobium sp. PLM2.Bin73]
MAESAPWEIAIRFNNAKEISEAIGTIYDDLSSGIEPELAANKITFSSPEDIDHRSNANSKRWSAM